jgi:uncharacterized protein YdaU (DUF1376 family)
LPHGRLAKEFLKMHGSEQYDEDGVFGDGEDSDGVSMAQEPVASNVITIDQHRIEPAAPTREHRKAKAGARLPWFEFHCADFLTDVADFTQAETAGFIRLLAHYWRNGGVPSDDEEALRRLARMTTAQWSGGGRQNLADKFDQPGWRYRFLDEKREHAERVSLSKSRNGQAGGRAKAVNREAAAS